MMYEHKMVTVLLDQINKVLEDNSNDFWELVAVLQIGEQRELYFKRPIQEDNLEYPISGTNVPDFLVSKIKGGSHA